MILHLFLLCAALHSENVASFLFIHKRCASQCFPGMMHHSFLRPGSQTRLKHERFRRPVGLSRRYLNRFLFDPSEVDYGNRTGTKESASSYLNTNPTVLLPKDDYRTIHAAKILNVHNGDNIRAGVVGKLDNPGLVTDNATIKWIPEGKIKKAQPTKNGDPPGSLMISLESLSSPCMTEKEPISMSHTSVSLILALPRPLQLKRILPMVAQLGVDHLVLTSAQKVPKDYFGSQIFRKPEELKRLLIEGLCQAGDTRLPTITVVRHLKRFLEEDLDHMFPASEMARVIAHPLKKNSAIAPLRMTAVVFPAQGSEKPCNEIITGQQERCDRRILLAIGPEGGWDEENELQLFNGLGFQQVTLGSRTLRSDVAVVSLLSLAHSVCDI